MGQTSNPRKIGRTSGMLYVSLPPAILGEAGIEHGDRVVLEAENGQITMRPVEWRHIDHE